MFNFKEIENKKIWFTSDLHFCHDKEFLYSPRGFENIEEMNSIIIKNFNSVIAPDDILFILGDCMLKDDAAGINFMQQLNGIKFLVVGNHDTDSRLNIYNECGIFKDIEIGYRFSYGHISFLLSHYPTEVGNYLDFKKVVNLHGHTHSKEIFQGDDWTKYNVAVDAHKCFPVSLDKIMSDIQIKKSTVANMIKNSES